MVQIQAIKKCGFLRQIVEGAKRTAQTLRVCLVSAQGNIFSPNFQRGRILVSTSGSGQSGSFEIGVVGKEFTQDNVFGMTEEFLQLLDRLIADGATDDGQATNTDALFAAMIASDGMQGVSQMGSDYTGIGWPYGGGRW